MKNILLVDDDHTVLRAVSRELPEFKWVTAENGEEALQRIQEQHFDLLITDVRMEVMDGVALVRNIQKLPSEQVNPYMETIVLTGYADKSAIEISITESGAYRVAKPWGEELEITIRRALEHASMRLVHDRESRMLTQQLIQNEKLAALGTMVSGVAHELNNPLTGMQSIVQQMLADNRFEHASYELNLMRKNVERCLKITSDILIYSHNAKYQKENSDIHNILNEAINLQSQEHRDIAFNRNFASIPMMGRVDADRLYQVFMNLIKNAAEAMKPQNTSKELTIKTQLDSNQKQFTISFVDSGPGLEHHAINQIFDPFFTTKGIGEGTGLGLSLCQTIIKRHGGILSAQNNPERGATFTIQMPVDGGE